MRKNIFLLPIFFFAICLISCEKRIFCKKGEGDVISVTRTVSDFKKIDFKIDGDLIIRQSDTLEITIEAQENLVNEIETNVNGETLEIETDGCIKTDQKIRVYVKCPDLNSIDILGSGDVYHLKEWTFSNLDLIITGSGNIRLENIIVENGLNTEILGSGNIILNNPQISGNLNNLITGSGNIIITDMSKANEVENKIEGSGDISISSVDTLDFHNARITGDGDIQTRDLYAKNVEVRIDGSGNAFVNAINSLIVKIYGSGNVYYTGNPLVDVEISGSGRLVNDNK